MILLPQVPKLRLQTGTTHKCLNGSILNEIELVKQKITMRVSYQSERTRKINKFPISRKASILCAVLTLTAHDQDIWTAYRWQPLLNNDHVGQASSID